MYTEICKIMCKEVKEYLHKWKNISCSWLGRLNTVKMGIVLRLICRLVAVPIKILLAFLQIMTSYRCKQQVLLDIVTHWRRASNQLSWKRKEIQCDFSLFSPSEKPLFTVKKMLHNYYSSLKKGDWTGVLRVLKIKISSVVSSVCIWADVCVMSILEVMNYLGI